MLGKAKPVPEQKQKQGQKMVIQNFTRIHSKKLGFLAGFVVTKNSKSYSVCIWSPKGIYGNHYFNSLSQAIGFCHFLGVPKNQTVSQNKQISLFN